VDRITNHPLPPGNHNSPFPPLILRGGAEGGGVNQGEDEEVVSGKMNRRQIKDGKEYPI